MTSLAKALTSAFRPPRAPDVYRKSRTAAKKLAAQFAIEIQPMNPGFNVWAPKSVADTSNDPYDSDHYANDWDEVLERVTAYSRLV